MANGQEAQSQLAQAPKGWMLLMILGPGLMWCGEYIGSGEVILSTRSGAIFGVSILWIPIMAIFAKFWIGLAGAHYTVTTGEGMIDMLGRTPGPRNWVLWPVLVGQVCASMISTAGLASAAGAFASYFFPDINPVYFAWAAVLVVLAVVWQGVFEPLKQIMSILVLFIIIGTLAVAFTTWPGTAKVLNGLFGFEMPQTPAWFNPDATQAASAWKEILPLLGWAAGGFASQVWYTYWVLGAGYGMARGRGYGKACDTDALQELTTSDVEKILGWRRVVTLDASMALFLGVVVTVAFLIAGAGVLGAKEIAPEGPEVALQLSTLFSEQWGTLGGHLFVFAGLCAMLSTMFGQFAGWPRLLADCGRLLFPTLDRYPWKKQFRVILTVIAISNLVILYNVEFKPVVLVQISAVLDGLLLTPLQALAVAWVLFGVMPKMFKGEHRSLIKPHPIMAAGLALAFFMFSFVCISRLGDLF